MSSVLDRKARMPWDEEMTETFDTWAPITKASWIGTAIPENSRFARVTFEQNAMRIWPTRIPPI